MTKSSASSLPRLTDAQLVALSQAAQREDSHVLLPPNIRGAAIPRFLNGLLAKGLIEALPDGEGRAETDVATTYIISAHGLVALGIEEAPQGDGTAQPIDFQADAPIAAGASALEVSVASEGCAPMDGAQHVTHEPSDTPEADLPLPQSATPPRTSSKLAQVIALLERPEGACMSELKSATGWMAHTTRAALTGLRKRGYPVELERGAEGRESCYRITKAPTASDAAA